MRAQLIPLDGGKTVDIVKDLTLVGRKEDCDLQLDHKSVSKMHCVIVKTDGLLVLRDLGSTNGTRVNGQRVRRAALLPNDQLTIANFKFRVHLGPDADGAPNPNEPYEHTQHMDAEEMQGVLKEAQAEKERRDAAADEPKMQRNVLPDVYPEDKKK